MVREKRELSRELRERLRLSDDERRRLEMTVDAMQVGALGRGL